MVEAIAWPRNVDGEGQMVSSRSQSGTSKLQVALTPPNVL